MSYLRPSTGFVGLAVFAVLPGMSAASTYFLRRDNVLPVVFEDKLTLKENRPGDVFAVRVTDTGQLPVGAELLGRIDRIHPPRGNRPASMDLRFTDILLPDHSRVPLDAAPLPLDNKFITRDGDGRMTAKQDLRQQQNDVIGGAIGGYIIGSIFHRRFTGAVIGTMIGVSAAESERAKDSNQIANPGDKVGALINHDVRIDYVDSPSRIDINRRLDQGMDGPVRGYHGPVGGRQPVASISLTYRNRDLSFPDDARPYRIGKEVMVPLEPTASQFKLDVDRRPDRTIYVDGPDHNLRLTLSSREARIDGRRIDLPRTVLELNGVLYVPLSALALLLKEDLFVNGQKFQTN
jgi:hypothetical protein